MFGFGKIPKGVRFWKAWGRFDEATKDLWDMKEKGMLKSKTVWGGIFLALIPLVQVVLPLLNVPEDMAANIIKILMSLGAILVPVGVKHAIEKAKK